MARIVAADTPRVHEDLVADQVEIVRWAMTLPWGRFVRRLQDWLDEHDPGGPEPERTTRSLTCSKTIDDRWVLDGLLDPIAGSILDRELSRLERQLFLEDWNDAAGRLGRDPLAGELARTSTQRRADALVVMAERSATLPEDGRRGRPLFTVLVGHHSFVKVCELTNGIQARPSQLVTYLDRALVETIVFDGPFHAIEASSQRTFTGRLRRAVLAMHRGCTHDHCVATIDDCQIDHHHPASHGGATSQDNARPLCPKHNRQEQPSPTRHRLTPGGRRTSATMMGTEVPMKLRARLEELAARQVALYKARRWHEAAVLEPAKLDLERRIAAAEGRPFADAIEWSPRWSSGAPLPHLLTDGRTTLLTYYLQVDDPTWDGTWTKVRDPSSDDAEPVAIVSFTGCIASSLGPPNDEVLHGHPLHGSGLRAYDAHIVRRSPWVERLRAIDAVHERHDPARWAGLHHYLLVFHDEVFECIAEAYAVEVVTAPLRAILVELAGRLVD